MPWTSGSPGGPHRCRAGRAGSTSSCRLGAQADGVQRAGIEGGCRAGTEVTGDADAFDLFGIRRDCLDRIGKPIRCPDEHEGLDAVPGRRGWVRVAGALEPLDGSRNGQVGAFDKQTEFMRGLHRRFTSRCFA